MVSYLRFSNRTQRATVIGLCLVAVLGIIACLASVVLSGTKTGAVLSLMVTAGPVLLYAAIVAPILFPFSLYATVTPFDTLLTVPGSPFGTVTKMLGIATAAAMLFYMIRTKTGVQPPWAAILWLIFYLWVTSTLWWAIDTTPSFPLLSISWSLLGLFLVTSMFRVNGSTLRTAARAVLIGGVVAALYGVYFFHSGGNLAHTGGRLWIQSDDAQINPDHFANSLLLPASLALVGALWSTRTRSRVLYIGMLLLILIAVALTGARSAMLGFGAISLFLLIKDRHRFQLGAVLGAGGLLGVAAAGPFLISRFSTALSTGGAGRLSIWNTGWAAFKQYWLFGAGFGNFPLAYDKFYLLVFTAIDPHFDRASHNMLLRAGVETGIIGLAMLIIAWVQTFRMLSPIPEGDYRYPLRLAVQGAIIGLFVSGMFADIMITKYVWLAFMLAVMTYNAAPASLRQKFSPVVSAEVAARA